MPERILAVCTDSIPTIHGLHFKTMSTKQHGASTLSLAIAYSNNPGMIGALMLSPPMQLILAMYTSLLACTQTHGIPRTAASCEVQTTVRHGLERSYLSK